MCELTGTTCTCSAKDAQIRRLEAAVVAVAREHNPQWYEEAHNTISCKMREFATEQAMRNNTLDVLTKELEELRNQHAAMAMERDDAAEKHAAVLQERDAAARARDEMLEQMDAMGRECDAAVQALEATRQELSDAAARGQDAVVALQRVRKERDELRVRNAALAKDVHDARALCKAFSRERAAACKMRDEGAKECDDALALVRQREREIVALRQQRDTANSCLVTLTRERAVAVQRAAEHLATIQKLEARLAKEHCGKSDHAQLETDMHTLRQERDDAREAAQRFERHMEQRSSSWKVREAHISRCKALESKVVALNAELDSVSEAKHDAVKSAQERMLQAQVIVELRAQVAARDMEITKRKSSLDNLSADSAAKLFAMEKTVAGLEAKIRELESKAATAAAQNHMTRTSQVSSSTLFLGTHIISPESEHETKRRRLA